MPSEAQGRRQHPLHDPSGDENHPLEAYRFFRDELKAEYIQLIPIVERAAPETIVLVEQNLAATLALVRRVYIVNNGHVVLEGPAGELNGSPQILERFLGV
jgi:ABC-type branched-subunit amino acid transport system ATPase component